MNKSGWKFSWMHPRYPGDSMFMFVCQEKIMRGEFTDAGEVCCKPHHSNKHKSHFDRLQSEICSDIICGDWHGWEMDVVSQDIIIFNRAGTRRLALVQDRTFIFGVISRLADYDRFKPIPQAEVTPSGRRLARRLCSRTTAPYPHSAYDRRWRKPDSTRTRKRPESPQHCARPTAVFLPPSSSLPPPPPPPLPLPLPLPLPPPSLSE